MESFHASSSEFLLRTLGKKIVPVPPRTKRTTYHTENWVTCYFLVAVAESDLLQYPLCVEPGDRPDLVLSSQSGKVGIEITEAVPEDRVQVDKYSERNRISGPRFIPQYRVCENRPKKEIEDIAKGRGQDQDRPLMRDQIEENWIEAMTYRVKCKAEKFASQGFAKHDRNWLLIYDNWSPAVHGYQIVAKPLAQELYNCIWPNPFEKVFILRGDNKVWEFSRNAEIMKLHGPGQSSYSVQLAN